MLYKTAKKLFDITLSPELGTPGDVSKARPMVHDQRIAPHIKLKRYPKISIVTPSYNNAQYVQQTLQSVLGQAYPNLEYVVMDGGSTDGSVEIIKRFENQLSYWCSRQDKGQANAINNGFTHCSGEIMCYLNSDDILLDGSLLRVAEHFDAHPEIDAIYSHRILIDERGWEIGRWILPRHRNSIVFWRDFVPQETLFWRKSAWERIGGYFDENMHFALDWDMILRLVTSGATFARLPAFNGAFRIRQGQKSTSMTDTFLAEAERIYGTYLGYIPSIGEIRRRVFPYLVEARMMELALKFGFLRIQ